MGNNIKTIKLIDPNGVVFGIKQEGGELVIRSKTLGWTGSSFQLLRVDPSAFALKVVSHAESEVHEGHSFKVDIYEADFDKTSEIGILFTTPNTANRFHVVPLVYASSAAVFHILETPVIDVGNYPTTFYTPINRNRNLSQTSTVRSIRATPVVNRVSLKLKANTTPITGDGTVLHAEVIGAGKKGGGGGMRDTDEYILKQNTNYYFRLKGTANGADNSVASLHVNWFEHTDLE